MVDQSVLTGEYVPAEKAPGDKVFSMSVVLSGRLHVRVTETGEETSASKMIKLIEHSLEHKVAVQTATERFADTMVLPTLALGLLGYGISGAGAMMAIINADFGTGIRIAGPLALLSSLSAAARSGILVKKGVAIETFGRVDAIVFDKTGTLTEEVPAVSRIVPLDGAFGEDALLEIVASAEGRFRHPIAKAILRKAAAHGVYPKAVDDSDYHVGFGIRVQMGGSAVRVGSLRFMIDSGIQVPASAGRHVEESRESGGSLVFAAIDGRAIGLLELSATPRREAPSIVEALRRKRRIKEICLLSGDHEAPTRALARGLGIERFVAEVSPHEKAEYVAALQRNGLTVAMIGDGINDTAALSQADCSISLRGAADAATDAADVVFMDGNLAKLDLLFDLSENLARNVRRSFLLALLPNSFCIAGALAGVFGLGTSLVLNNVFNLVAAGNGMQAQSPFERRAVRRARESAHG